MRIAVTGATGFVGGAVCQAARARGWEVHGFGRRRVPGIGHWDVDCGVLAAPPEVDAVVHAAAAVTDWGSPARVWNTNVDGTRNVALSFRGKRFVHISTASVYDPAVPTVAAVESRAPVTRYLNAYAASKASAEVLLSRWPHTIILRPHAVYGPGDPTLLPRVLGAIRGPHLFVVGDGSALHSLTFLGNLVSAILLACLPDAPAGTYNIADAEPISLNSALESLISERKLPVRVRHLPIDVSWAAAGFLESAHAFLRIGQSPRLTRYAISHLAYERTLDLTAARQRLGYRPTPTSFAGAATW
ncbi:NAD-dependent epimerase/dehydratase family protein [Fodinicola feengrottensis]|uniref:NAD(P)-dependent oxidoreductase n=1 Tax=Fodinicola feengrottensis TaxID=435914 RepID=A0ABN2G8W6_9ACTN|nr:NAD(P)-dependent oxidoreductase [Fodinicola feengrottensis]